MRVALHIDSAKDDEMRRAVLAWHFTTPFFKTPGLALDGLVVKVCGSSWNIESPPIEATRAALIIDATTSDDHLDWLKAKGRKSQALDLFCGEGATTELWRQAIEAHNEQLREV
jgi:hypothetical protein